MYNIEKTKQSDLIYLMEIFHQAQAALKKINVDQWQNGYPSEQIILSDIDEEISYVVKNNNQIIATAAIYIGNEPTYDKIYDGVWITDNKPYCVIHRIAVRDDYKGKNIASYLISYGKQIAQLNNAESIRIDTHRDNIPMQKMLNKNGFIYCGIIYLLDGKERFAFEKPL